MPQAAIVLLTDFGTRDAYVGIVKGVLANLAPDARLIDLTHAIPPGDVRAAAFTLWQAQDFMPPKAIYLAVVDPGVGTGRAAIALRLPNGIGVGPDNGLFSWILKRGQPVEAVDLEPTRLSEMPLSATFHGRDLFAPAAARLATGMPLAELGSARSEVVRLPHPHLEAVPGGLRGEVLWIDGFGNAITSLGRMRLSGSQVELTPCWQDGPPRSFGTAEARVMPASGLRLPLVHTFGDVRSGEPLAYIGSSSLVEIGVRGGRADERLGLSPGQTVMLLLEG